MPYNKFKKTYLLLKMGLIVKNWIIVKTESYLLLKLSLTFRHKYSNILMLCITVYCMLCVSVFTILYRWLVGKAGYLSRADRGRFS